MVEVPRRLPVSSEERLRVVVDRMAPGSDRGSTRFGAPVSDFGSMRSQQRGVSGGVSVLGSLPQEDLFPLTVTGAQTLTLTYLPQDMSEDVKLNSFGQTRGVDWMRTGQTLSVLAAMDARAGDELTCEYTYLRGLSVMPPHSLAAFIVGGASGLDLTTADAITWTSHTVGSSGASVSGAAWSPDLGVWCAVTGAATSTSVDGVTWTALVTPSSVITLYAIAWAAGVFCAVGANGSLDGIVTSPDGVTWTVRDNGTTRSLYGVAWSPGLSLWCAVGSVGVIATSPDAITWTQRVAGAGNGSLQSVAWSPANALWVTVGQINSAGLIRSSPDGVTWTDRLTSGAILQGVAWSAGLALWCAVGVAGTVLTSPDGITWTARTSGTTNDLYAVAWSSVLALFTAVGAAGTVLTSPDGITWTARTSGTTNGLYAVGNG